MFDEPIFEDEYFRRKPKKGSSDWTIVDAPSTLVPIADTHAHLDMLPNPALALARAGVHDVRFVQCMTDPLSERRLAAYGLLDEWILRANVLLRHMSTRICGQGWNYVPKVRLSVGVHPHEASRFDDGTEARIMAAARDPRTSAIGEIGLDYHYDFSPREDQRRVFERQLLLAHETGLPVVLHIREAFGDAYAILDRVGFPPGGTLVHCYTADAAEVERWVEADCYIAFGGALTFASSDDIRRAARIVPRDRLLTETDAPYMAPVPFRGQNCDVSHVVWNAMALFSLLTSDDPQDCSQAATAKRFMVYSSDEEQTMRAFFTQTYDNALAILDKDPLPFQTVPLEEDA